MWECHTKKVGILLHSISVEVKGLMQINDTAEAHVKMTGWKVGLKCWKVGVQDRKVEVPG
jgi:hypothetical protein